VTTIGDLALEVRSNNAGPFWVTMELFMPDAAGYAAVSVVDGGRLAPTTPAGRGAATAAVPGAATGLAAVVAGSRRGYLPIAAASGWALTTSALNTRRSRPTRAANALGAALIAAATVARSRRG
jgi:hypothetical protein